MAFLLGCNLLSCDGDTENAGSLTAGPVRSAALWFSEWLQLWGGG